MNTSSKEPWKLSSYGPCNDKEKRTLWFETRREKLHSQAKIIFGSGTENRSDTASIKELFLNTACLYNSLCRSEDYCITYAREKDSQLFAELVGMLDREPYNSISVIVIADLYRRAGLMEKAIAIAEENIASSYGNSILEHIRQLACQGVAEPIKPGDILHLYTPSSVNTEVDRYFYHDNIL